MRLAGGGLRSRDPGWRRARLADFFCRKRCLLDPALQRGLLLHLLLLGEKCRLDALAPLTFEVGGILLVDLPLLFRRGIGTGDIEASILHEVEIGVAAAWLAAAREFRVTLFERGGARFPHHKLFSKVGAFLEIGRPARPPLRPRLAWQQHGAAEHERADLHRGYGRT